MTNVFFRPWVGENYKAGGFNGKRILVLGESCYCGTCPDCAQECPDDWWEEEEWQGEEADCRDKIPGCVARFLASNKGRTYRRFTDVFMGHKCTAEEIQNLWQSIVFYNYVQTAPDGPRIRPEQWQWATGEKPFFEVLAEYNPDVIIAWGRELWNNMPTGFRLDDSFKTRWGDGLRYYNNGKRDIPVYACYHPSTTYFSDEDTDYFKRLLEKVKAGDVLANSR